MEEGQELHCHNCDRYVQFVLDLSRDGNYTLNCPKCGHPHYRRVRDGKITDSRWATANPITVYATSSTTTSIVQIYSSSGGTIGYQSFLDRYTGSNSST